MATPIRCERNAGAHSRAQRPWLAGIDWRLWLGLGLTFSWLGLGVWYVLETTGFRGLTSQPADVLGSFLEGAFAPLAFLWLVIGYFLQQRELTQNTDALRTQSQALAASEVHARQETFLQIAQAVRGQLGIVIGLLYISSQGAAGSGRVSGERVAELWARLNDGDPEVFSRALLQLHLTIDDEPARIDLFYGTEVRARHSNNVIRSFERLLARARDTDPDGMIADALLDSGHGFVYQLATRYRECAPVALREAARTGVDVRI